jgi:hypothetical protein
VIRDLGRGGVLLVADMLAPSRRVSGVVDFLDRQMVMKRGGAVPVFSARLEEDAVAGTDHLDLPAAALAEADALGDVDRLAVRVRLPGYPRAGVKWTLLTLSLESSVGRATGSHQ